MQSLSEEITHKQRILFYGSNAQSLINLSSKILTFIKKDHDVILEAKHDLSEAPLVLIENQIGSYEHHILVVGELDGKLNDLESLADKTPKAGSIVFNEKDKEIAKICKKERVDVVKLPFKPEKGNENIELLVVKAVLSRLRVPESDFSKAIESI